MQPLFLDTRILDKKVRDNFCLTEDIMMENATMALENEIQSFYINNQTDKNESFNILILAGSGNNGADGYALARRLISNKNNVTVCKILEPKSEMCKVQENRAKKIGVNIQTFKEINSFSEKELSTFNIIVDCIFGSGFHGNLPTEIDSLIQKVNQIDAFKIACDVPTGLNQEGNSCSEVFMSSVTVTMGANKVCLYSDTAKQFVGEIKTASLGVSENKFTQKESPEEFLLEESDMKLPHRKNQNVNKGSFGHAAIVVGEKIGAGVIVGSSALRFGSGLVTLVNFEKEFSSGQKIQLDDEGFLPQTENIIPYELMCSQSFPKNTTAVALGMGLGHNNLSENKYFDFLSSNVDLPCVLDADVFYSDNLFNFLKSRSEYYLKNCENPSDKKIDAKIVLTPHPKEFVSLLQKCSILLDSKKDLSIQNVIENKIELIKKFCIKFPGVVLLLKGANVTIGIKEENKPVQLFVNPYGTNVLAKAGSGDVLSGLICSLLAQKYSSIDATISASLAHTFASRNITCDFSLTPFSLIKAISKL